MDIGSNIKENREKNNITQKELANALGLEATTISKYESNKILPSIDILKKISGIFGISVDEILKTEEFDLSKINLYKILKEQKEMKLKGNIYHNTQILFTYNTNHIEGSTLTEEQTRFIFETKSVLFKKDTIINVDDMIETTNHFELIDYMIDTAYETLTEELIKKYHAILKKSTFDSKKEWFNVGEYKGLSNSVGDIMVSSPKNVKKDIQNLLKEYNKLEKIEIEDIIKFHADFEKVHPFQDGNGRIGRIIAFKECLRNNIIPFIILEKDKLFYYRGLSEYQKGKEKGYLIDTCLNAQDKYILMIKKYLNC